MNGRGATTPAAKRELLPEAAQLRLRQHLRHVLSIHFDPAGGAAFWLSRQRELGIDARREIREPQDLWKLGPMRPRELTDRPLLDFIPRCQHQRQDEWIVAQTGGTTGAAAWTAYRRDEFLAAFVRPFQAAARHVGFPRRQAWLFVGPSGPHIIGKAAARLARCLGSPEPFSVDFDPRWAKKLPEGSFAHGRYLEHVIRQALHVVNTQNIGVLFTTPRVLQPLAEGMTEPQRARVTGVHYGGTHLEAAQLEEFQRRWFPNAVHLAGYGNTLFGCCLELQTATGRTPEYFPHGPRLLFSVLRDGECSEGVSPAEPGQRGRVAFTRLDETMLLTNVLERDEAELIQPPAEAPPEFVLPGVRDPRPLSTGASGASVGLY